jgi:DNA-binding GntR family transcriptional regulator
MSINFRQFDGGFLVALRRCMIRPMKTTRRPAPARALPLASPAIDDATTVQQRAYLALRDSVLSGLFLPGEPVTLRVLTERLKLGAMPVREALKRLIAEGAFEAMPNHSARVPLVSPEEITQIMELRLVLESQALRLAADHLSKHRLDELELVVEQMRRLVFPRDVNEFARLNRQFHFGIYVESRNEPLLKLIEYLWLRMASSVYAVGVFASHDAHRSRNAATQFNANLHHQRLIVALRAHDIEAAVAALSDDLSVPVGAPDFRNVLEARQSAVTARGAKGKTRAKRAQKP